MKTWESYWKRFEKTGDIRDYLNYTACTREDTAGGSVYANTAAKRTAPAAVLCEEVRAGNGNPATETKEAYAAVVSESITR
ncbi:MAG: hypothetical protein IJY09_03425 [Lachnospiraceae bacterium]|nr:hypothetical protein [Lachnospiraceae bacterium]